MLDAYQEQQLTSQTECYIHTHPHIALNQVSVGELEQATPVVTKATGTTLGAGDDVVSFDPAGGAFTVLLPPALKSKEYHITMVGTGTLTITPDGTDTILGYTSVVLTEQWSSAHLKSDNAGNWIFL